MTAQLAAEMAPAVRLRGLRKEFGGKGSGGRGSGGSGSGGSGSGGRGSGTDRVVAVDDVDLEIGEGEFVTLLGPSGSGKTTVLRLIAGFEQPTSGQVLLRGRDVTADAPFDRDVNTVFQDYALFPHLDVIRNVEYGLRVKGVAKAERRARALGALRGARLEDFAKRTPAQLSGGQRQRVALARALVNRPAVLLLDEPLGALDLKLREQMQVELKGIQREVGITFVFVTHDQEEALTMSDRIVVFNNGRVEQVGTPAEVYERPGSEFVAGFVGTSNLLRPETAQALAGHRGLVSVRPEKVRMLDVLAAVPSGHRRAPGTVREVVYAGSSTRYVVDLDAGGSLVAIAQNLDTSSMEVMAYRGRPVVLVWRPEHEYHLSDGRD